MRIASALPIDANDKPIQSGNLEGTVLARTYDATISSATSITLQEGTTSFEILAIAQPIFLRFAAGVTTSNFDAVIGTGETKVFSRTSDITVISVLEAAASATVAVIER